MVKKEGIQKEQGEKIKDESRIEPKKGRSRLQTILGVVNHHKDHPLQVFTSMG